MKIIKCYENYKELKKSLKSRTYNLTNDSIGQYNNGDYSVDITLREYLEGSNPSYVFACQYLIRLYVFYF